MGNYIQANKDLKIVFVNINIYNNDHKGFSIIENYLASLCLTGKYPYITLLKGSIYSKPFVSKVIGKAYTSQFNFLRLESYKDDSEHEELIPYVIYNDETDFSISQDVLTANEHAVIDEQKARDEKDSISNTIDKISKDIVYILLSILGLGIVFIGGRYILKSK